MTNNYHPILTKVLVWFQDELAEMFLSEPQHNLFKLFQLVENDSHQAVTENGLNEVLAAIDISS